MRMATMVAIALQYFHGNLYLMFKAGMREVKLKPLKFYMNSLSINSSFSEIVNFSIH